MSSYEMSWIWCENIRYRWDKTWWIWTLAWGSSWVILATSCWLSGPRCPSKQDPSRSLPHDRFRESQSQFATRVKQLFEHVRMENSNVSQRQCDKIARELLLGCNVTCRKVYFPQRGVPMNIRQCKLSILDETATAHPMRSWSCFPVMSPSRVP